jgi:hypothetical protein
LIDERQLVIFAPKTPKKSLPQEFPDKNPWTKNPLDPLMVD